MIIVGAGMAGLMAARYFERKFTTTVWEMQSGLPNNHSALLRFRTDAVSKAMGIPFEKVMVHKALVHGSNFVDQPNPYVCNQYSLKTNNKILERSIWDLSSGYRYIAPSNFIRQLAAGLEIYYGKNFKPGDTTDPVISTIPMPIMMKKIGWNNKSHFDKQRIWTLNADLAGAHVDVYQTIYFSDICVPYYRASLIGNRLIAEFVVSPEEDDRWEETEEIITEILDFFGISEGVCSYQNVSIKSQEYGKIVPISDDERKEFMYTLTRDYGIYSLGRFATWRQILLDDLVNDLEVIESLISSEGRRKLYNQSLVSARK